MSLFYWVREGEIVASREFGDGEEIPQLAANKGAWLPEIVVMPQFDPATEVRTGPEQQITDTAVLQVYTVRAKEQSEVAQMRAGKVAAVKAEAGRRILVIMPEWKQRNFLALGQEMITDHGPDRTQWPQDMQTLYTAVRAEWEQIKAIRARSDQLEATIPTDAAGIAAFDPLAGWE
jgi:hypothetical protein